MSTQFVPMPPAEGHESSNKTSFPRARHLYFGAFHLDVMKEELFKDGVRVKLQPKVCQALLALLEKPGEIVTREGLCARLWPSDTSVNYDANVNTAVNKLRLALGEAANQPAFVETIPRKGYTFVAKVEFADRPVAHLAPQGLRLEELTPVTAAKVRKETKASLFRPARHSGWFMSGLVALVIASMLLGAALALYAHH